jgi:signal transduction histidine kinase
MPGGNLSGGAVADSNVSAGAVAGDGVTGGSGSGGGVTGGSRPGGAVASSNVSGGAVTGDGMTGGNLSGGAVAGDGRTGGSGSGGGVAGGSVTGDAGARDGVPGGGPAGGAPGVGLPGGVPGGGGGEDDSRPAGFLAELRRGPAGIPMNVPPVVRAVRLILLVAVIVTVPISTPHFGHGGLGIATAVVLAVSAVAWAIWNYAGDRPQLWMAMLVIMGAAGGVLAGLSSLSTAVAICLVVAVAAGARLPSRVSAAIVAETVAAFLIAGIPSGAASDALIGWTAGCIGMWAFGLTRRAYLLRAVEAEQALEQARRAHAAENQAAALAERARIAREIHDVLAHALAAVSVNLQAAEGLLEAVPDKSPELAKVVECVERAGALTKEGMAETRRAILALRDDSAGASAGYASRRAGRPAESGPAADPADRTAPQAGRLLSRLRALADDHGAAGDAAVEFTVAGAPWPLGAERALTVYRTAQEALTNARKHAPGQPVSLTVTYTPQDMTLRVINPLPPSGTEGPLAHAGTGYGLTGLRERAALATGTLTAAPGDGQWTVRLRLPA